MNTSKVNMWNVGEKTYAIGRITKDVFDETYRCFEERTFNCIFEVTTNFFGKKKYNIVHEEEIPSHIIIELACFGSYNKENWQPEIFNIAKNNYQMPNNF